MRYKSVAEMVVAQSIKARDEEIKELKETLSQFIAIIDTGFLVGPELMKHAKKIAE